MAFDENLVLKPLGDGSVVVKADFSVDGTYGLEASDIPDLDADKITSGTFDSDRLATGGSNNQVLTKTASGQSWQDAAGAPTEEQVYGHTANIITAGTGITVTDDDAGNTITITVANVFTDADETKLDGIATGAEVNVQSNWTETNSNDDSFIQNKPTITDPVQSDWNETDTTDLSYIENKPTLFSGSYNDLTDKPNIAGALTVSDIYDFNVAIITEGTGITIDDDDSGNTITISVTNEFTDAHETKLDGIEIGAEVNVQSDWTEADSNSDAFIQNKPSLFSGNYNDLSNRPSIPGEDDIYTYTADFITEGTGVTIVEESSTNTITISVTNEFTDADETKLDGIATGAEVNVQSNWTETNSNDDSFIQNKPTLFSGSYNDLSDTPTIPDEVTEDDIYNYTAGFITDGTGITIDDDDSGNTITISVTNEFTDADETKLDGIETGAEVNVQSDWNEADSNSDAFIQNKPTITDQVQSDWNETDTTDLSYIENKPTIPDEVTEEDIYDHNTNILIGGTGITLTNDDTDHTVTVSRDALSADDITSGTFDSSRLASGGSDGQFLTRTATGQEWETPEEAEFVDEGDLWIQSNALPTGTQSDSDQTLISITFNTQTNTPSNVTVDGSQIHFPIIRPENTIGVFVEAWNSSTSTKICEVFVPWGGMGLTFFNANQYTIAQKLALSDTQTIFAASGSVPQSSTSVEDGERWEIGFYGSNSTVPANTIIRIRPTTLNVSGATVVTPPYEPSVQTLGDASDIDWDLDLQNLHL